MPIALTKPSREWGSRAVQQLQPHPFDSLALDDLGAEMKTARFADVVKAAGKPQPYTLWTDPRRDREFQAAIGQDRVMSVHQETVGTKADYGQVGYAADQSSQILIFPKSLAAFRERRIIGIKYDQLETPKASPRKNRPRPPAKRTEKKPAPKRKPKPSTPITKTESEQTKPRTREELVEGIRSAMNLLDRSKAPAAYQTLAKLLD